MAESVVIPPRNLSERKRVLLVVDLAGTSRAVARFDAVRLAEFINTFFAACGRAVAANGGRIVTFLGDGFFAVFDEEKATDAIATATSLISALGDLRDAFGVDVEIGANIHQSVVAEGEFEPDGHYNAMGTGVMHTFRLGAGPGIRITEPVYRQLPSDERTPWRKHRPPAVYTLQSDAS